MDIRRLTGLGAACALLLLLGTPVDCESPPCRIQDCANYKVIRYYEELGCVRSDGTGDCCATRYDCSAFVALDKRKCHYKGKVFDLGAQIDDETRAKCTPTCTCVKDNLRATDGEVTFQCAHVDCPEYFEKPLEKDCFRQHAHEHCCSTGTQCVNATHGRKDLVKCVYGGKTFYEGQYISNPESNCLSCICQEGFDGTLREPWCRRFSCDYTLALRPSEIVRCAPVFWVARTCCPVSWHCPSEDDVYLVRSEPTADNDNQCTFGTERLNIGDEFRAGQIPCIKCRCDIPPFITCTQFEPSVCGDEEGWDRV